MTSFLLVIVLPVIVGAAAKTSILPSHREIQCPESVAPVTGVRHSLSEYREDLKNHADEPAVVSWLNYDGKEIFVTSLQPDAEIRLQTFIGDRFIIRSSTDADVIFLGENSLSRSFVVCLFPLLTPSTLLLSLIKDLTVGVHHIDLPAGVVCDPLKSAISHPRKPKPSGELTPAATVRGWVSDSPCDLIGSWVVFNDTGAACQEIGERWMVDLTSSSNKAEALGHFEVTYLSHLFRFAMTDKTIVRDFLVSPTSIPNCRTAVAPALATTTTTLPYLHLEDVPTANTTAPTCTSSNYSIQNSGSGELFASMDPSSIVFQHPRAKTF